MSLKLYYSPGAISLVPHIALEEAGADYELARVMLAQREHYEPEYLAINHRARVPSLATDQGIITETVAVVNFVADSFGKDGSVPRGDAYQAALCNQLLCWFATSVHIGFAQVWRVGQFADDESAHEAIISWGHTTILSQFSEIEGLCGEAWLVGSQFTAADAYALTFYRWGRRIGIDMTAYPKWTALIRRILERPAVQRVLADEGLRADEFAQ